MKVDRTGAILFQLEKMLAVGALSESLRKELLSLIVKVKSGETNLFDYRQVDSREQFGNDLIEAIISANRRRRKYEDMENNSCGIRED